MGTPAYMSPEQAGGETRVDGRSDLYSLACVLYEMLAGEPPYTGATPEAVIAKRFAGPPLSLRTTRPTLPAQADKAMATALAVVPADRFPSARAFTEALARPSSRIPRWPIAAAAAALVMLTLAVYTTQRTRATSVWNGQPIEAAGPSGPGSLAVLPFETEGDSSNAYFADGIAGEIRGKLSSLPALRVIASGSSNYYRRSPLRPEDIARELGVRYLLTGTVQVARTGAGPHHVRIRPELVEISARGGAPETLWQHVYDTTVANVFAVQSAVASQVAQQLGVVLSPAARATLQKPPTQNLAAYNAYLRSQMDSNAEVGSPVAAQRDQAIAYAKQAVALDSTFAAGWARLAFLANDTVAARRAVALAPNAPEGHVARAFTLFWHAKSSSDYDAAKAEFDIARRLDPSSAIALVGLAAMARDQGNHSYAAYEAEFRWARQALALDPRSRAAAEILSGDLIDVRRYGEARDVARRAQAFHPSSEMLTIAVMFSYLGEGDLASAQAAFHDMPVAVDRSLVIRYALVWALDSADRTLLSKLPLSAFEGDSARWASRLADLSWLRGDTARARDLARVVIRAIPREDTTDSYREFIRLVASAYVGDRAVVMLEAPHWMASTPGETAGGTDSMLAQIYVVLGDRRRALDHLAAALTEPGGVSRAWLRIDPTWKSLRGDSRFDRLLADAG